MSDLYINPNSPQTPCIISMGGDRFINFSDLKQAQWPHNEIVDITPPTSYSHNWLYVGAKGEQFTVDFSARFPNPAAAHAWKYFLATSTGLIFNHFDYWGNRTGYLILRQVRFTDEKVFLHGQSSTFCGGNGVEIFGTLSFFPQPW